MTNVSATPKKRATRKGLFDFAVQTLEKQGWSVTRVPRGGKGSLRLISKGKENHKVSIRTSQDTWIAFPRTSDAKGWVTLDDVDYVIGVSVNDRHNPTSASVHMIPGDDARARFDRAWQARKAAGHTLPVGRGIWLSLFDKEAADPVSHVGAGMGLQYKALATVDLLKEGLPTGGDEADDDVSEDEDEEVAAGTADEPPLTIPEAKRRLAKTLGVAETAVKIIIEH